MVGTSSSARAHGVDRFYNPPAIRRQLQQQQDQQRELQKQPQKAARPKLRTFPLPAPAVEVRVPDDRVELDPSSSKPSFSASPPPPITSLPSPDGNLDRFLESTTPTVPTQYLPKMSLRSWRNCNGFESQQPYFCLGDLWESFREWSAYGAGVPLVLKGSELVVQYYVPYLSGIQLYVDSSRPHVTLRKPGDESDGEPYLDTTSEDSSESEASQLTEERSFCTSHIGQNANFTDDCEGCNRPVLPIFEYLERNPPYGREPLSDRISVLASKFPNLKTYKSCDLHHSSWLSVAWYPIYRIPMGPTLRDLDACFLTFHSLATPLKSSSNGHPKVSDTCNIRNITTAAKLQLPAFGLAPYKLKGSIWTSNGLHERQLASSLLQTADNWLRLLQVDHPDFRFFLSHHNTIPGIRAYNYVLMESGKTSVRMCYLRVEFVTR